MHAEIEITRARIMDCYTRQFSYLSTKPVEYVEELLHRAEDDLRSKEFSIRTAAEINRTACVLVLESRNQALKPNPQTPNTNKL